MSVTIRPYRPGDFGDLYDVCLRTGADGADASGEFSDPQLLGAVYVGPYLKFEPDLAFVLDDGGRPQGYVLGARDTAAFELACALEWWPALRSRHPAGSAPAGGADSGVVALLHDPPTADPSILREYPSHLHVDLLPRWQGAGLGRQLIDRLLAALAAAGSPGVHLGVSPTNAAAIGFYQRLGFADLGGSHPGARVLGRRLGPVGG